jgi:hypothetical protein
MVEGEGLMTINILDLWQTLVVEVFGSDLIFFVAILFGLIILAAVMRFSQRITLIMVISVSLMLSYYINKILAVILLLVLAGIGLAYSRFISRG